MKIYNDLQSICRGKGRKPKYKIIYVTPKKLFNGKLLNLLEKVAQKGLLSCIVIDEAHCCYWGLNTFRPDYGKLGILRRKFGDVPIMACTATANNEDVKQITNILG